MVSAIEIIELKSKKDYKAFVELPFTLYKNNKYWVPPLKADELKSLYPETNPAFEFCDNKFWIAKKNGKTVGRIAAIVNHTYNEKMGEKAGRFSRTEFIDDAKVVDALFSHAEAWLKDQGMTRIQGPLGFTNLDHQGMLVEGFEELPSAASEYHLPYYQEHLVRLGYDKETDWVEFRLKLDGIPEKAQRVAKMIKTRYELQVKTFATTAELKPFAPRIFEILNKAFSELFSVVNLNDNMVNYYVNRYVTLLNPKFVKLVFDKEDEIIAFIIGLPSLSEALQKTNGKLLPFGWWHLKKALKKPKVIDLMLTGVLPEYQKTGAAAILINELQAEMARHGVVDVETTGIFETNTMAIANWKNYEHRQHKRKRCWTKAL